MSKSILLLGAGGHAFVITDILHTMQDSNDRPLYGKIDFLDDASELAVGKLTELEQIGRNYDEVFCCIGNNQFRKELLEKVERLEMKVPVLVHPTAHISPSAVVKAGTVVEPGAIINSNSVIEEGCIISPGAIVDHNVTIGKYCHINAGAICKAGAVIPAGTKLDAGEIAKGY